MTDVEVSVTMITYNHEKYIRQALDSVFMQKTSFNFEVIVSEDASPDNTRSILLEYKEKYGDKLVLNLQEKNVGASKNSLSGRQLARGKYLVSLEGDDFWTDENKLQKQYDILENHPEYSAVCCNFMHVSSEGEVIKDNVLGLKEDCVKTMDDWFRDGYSLHTCTVFRRNIFGESSERYIKLRSVAPTMGDAITFTLLYDAGDIYVLKDVMAALRIAGSKDTTSFSFSQRKKAIKYTYMYINIYDALEEYLDGKYDFSQRKANRIAAVKLGKLKGEIEYSSKEMRELMKKQTPKVRILTYCKLIRMAGKKAFKKVRRTVNENNKG